MVEGTRHPQFEHALPGYGAFKKADVEDAMRREPASDLRPYAEARGWEFIDRFNPVGYWGIVADDSRLQFNVVRGVLPGDRPGVMFHKLQQIGVHYMHRQGWVAETGADIHKLKFKPQGSGSIFNRKPDPRPGAIGVPATVGAALVPEVATVPGFIVGNHMGGGLLGRLLTTADINLKDYGVRGMTLEPIHPPKVPPDFLERLMATSFAEALRQYAERPFALVKVDLGRVSIVIDGFLDDPVELDALGEAVSAMAHGLAEAGAAMHEPRPFTEPLPEIEWSPDMDPFTKPPFSPPVPWLPALTAFARERDAVVEAPIPYHLAFPRMPAPGTAFCVLRFTPPGTTTVARAAWHAEQTIDRYNTGRNVLLLPAAPAAEPTPPGGVKHADLKLNYAVSDGIFAAWDRRDWNANGGLGEMDALVQRGLGLARESGLADV